MFMSSRSFLVLTCENSFSSLKGVWDLRFVWGDEAACSYLGGEVESADGAGFKFAACAFGDWNDIAVESGGTWRRESICSNVSFRTCFPSCISLAHI